jgi:hypothetical protein
VVGGACVLRYDLDRAESGGIVFPFDAVKVEFVLQAA